MEAEVLRDSMVSARFGGQAQGHRRFYQESGQVALSEYYTVREHACSSNDTSRRSVGCMA